MRAGQIRLDEDPQALVVDDLSMVYAPELRSKILDGSLDR